MKRDVIVVLGKKLNPDGTMCEEFKQQIIKAERYLSLDEDALMLITGGKTRAEYPSEAETALESVYPRFRERVLLEKESKTTSENIKLMKTMLEGEDIDRMVVISGNAHEPRTRYMFRHFWPEIYPKLEFDGIPSSKKEWVLHTILFGMAVADPNDTFFVPVAKKLLRNG